jgi:hypothetical protein
MLSLGASFVRGAGVNRNADEMSNAEVDKRSRRKGNERGERGGK